MVGVMRAGLTGVVLMATVLTPSRADGASGGAVPAAGHSPATLSSATPPGPVPEMASSARSWLRVGPAPGSRAGSWLWPVPSRAPVAPYAAPPTRYAAGHRGVDFSVVSGSPVAAPASAVVRFAGVVVDRPVVTLDHGGGLLSSYEPVVAGLPVGSVVAAGAVIGSTASGGHCADGCLHVGVRVNGEYVSPMRFFAGIPRAVLLPMGSAG